VSGLNSLKHLKLRSVKTQLHTVNHYRATCFKVCPALRALDSVNQHLSLVSRPLPPALFAEPFDGAMDHYEGQYDDELDQHQDNVSDSGSYSSTASYRSRQAIKTPHIDEVTLLPSTLVTKRSENNLNRCCSDTGKVEGRPNHPCQVLNSLFVDPFPA
jgi:hypothetical protein